MHEEFFVFFMETFKVCNFLIFFLNYKVFFFSRKHRGCNLFNCDQLVSLWNSFVEVPFYPYCTNNVHFACINLNLWPFHSQLLSVVIMVLDIVLIRTIIFLFLDLILSICLFCRCAGIMFLVLVQCLCSYHRILDI